MILPALLLSATLAASPIDQVRDAEIAFARAFANRDQAAFFAMVADDATFLSATTTSLGKQQVIESWTRYFATAEMPFSWAPDRVSVSADGTLGLSTGPVYDARGNHAGDYISTWHYEAGPPRRERAVEGRLRQQRTRTGSAARARHEDRGRLHHRARRREAVLPEVRTRSGHGNRAARLRDVRSGEAVRERSHDHHLRPPQRSRIPTESPGSSSWGLSAIASFKCRRPTISEHRPRSSRLGRK